MDRISKWRFWWRHTDVVIRLIVINVTVAVVVFLLQLGTADVNEYIGLHPVIYELAKRPWGFFSYMWIHSDLWHLLSNMLFTFIFGRIYLRYQKASSLIALYVMGGWMGGLCYISGYYLFLAFDWPFVASPLVGASAAVMAVVFGISLYARWEVIRLWILGDVKLSSIAIGLLLMLLLSSGDKNYGGLLAHIGGAAIGSLYAFGLRKYGVDVTRPIISTARTLSQQLKLFCPQKSSAKPHNATYAPNSNFQRKGGQHPSAIKQIEIDAILNKIRQGGYGSLTTAEKRKLLEGQRERGKS